MTPRIPIRVLYADVASRTRTMSMDAEIARHFGSVFALDAGVTIGFGSTEAQSEQGLREVISQTASAIAALKNVGEQ